MRKSFKNWLIFILVIEHTVGPVYLYAGEETTPQMLRVNKSAEIQCSLCHRDSKNEFMLICCGCKTRAHAECLEELNQNLCPTLGCTSGQWADHDTASNGLSYSSWMRAPLTGAELEKDPGSFKKFIIEAMNPPHSQPDAHAALKLAQRITGPLNISKWIFIDAVQLADSFAWGGKPERDFYIPVAYILLSPLLAASATVSSATFVAAFLISRAAIYGNRTRQYLRAERANRVGRKTQCKDNLKELRD